MGRIDYESETMIAFSCKDHGADAGDVSPTLRSMGHDDSHANGGGQVAVAFAESAQTVTAGVLYQDSQYGVGEYDTGGALRAGRIPEHQMVLQPLSFDLSQITSKANRSRCDPNQPSSTINAASQMHCATTSAVRRLTPVECERLQGFPDHYTRVPFKRKTAADGPRYKSLGNSMAVNCMAWIGQRIASIL